MLDNWKRIRDVDYAPVVDPSLSVLYKLPAGQSTESLLGTLIEAVLDCAPRIQGLQLDHAGPLYHQLLQTARYDGSFYTSTAASVLLSELAMPPDWSVTENGWADADRLIALKVCDPACGTGTLLMAAAKTIEERFRAHNGTPDTIPILHLGLIEDVLHGLDINRHAIHLAASMLTLTAPKIDYNKMNLYNMRHGVDRSGEVRAGSLDILTDSAQFLPGLLPNTSQYRATASGYTEESPDIKGVCDLVIMNPPYTRNDIRNRHLSTDVRKRIQYHEKSLARQTLDIAHRKAIDSSAAATFFYPIADILLNQRGTLAMVQPFTVCTGTSAKGQRDLLTDPDRFHLELVVTSHDNRRICFSENTKIHECLIVARRATRENRKKRTAFISLSENPARASESHLLASAILKSLDGDESLLSSYGTIAWRNHDEVSSRMWNAACFYDQSLSASFDRMKEIPALSEIDCHASVGPGGRGVREVFLKAEKRQNPDIRVLWNNKSDRQRAMRTRPDVFVVAKKDCQRYAIRLWEKRSHLLLPNRMRTNLSRTIAVFSEEQILGSAFVPVTPHKGKWDKRILCKAWCVWLNSTFGVLAYLNLRQKNLTYPQYSMDGLRTLPVPNPHECDLASLAEIYDRYAEQELLPLPEIASDPVRISLDEAARRAVPGLDVCEVADWRRSIALEPTIHNEKDGHAAPKRGTG